MSRKSLGVVVAVVACLTVAGCGSDKKEPTAVTTSDKLVSIDDIPSDYSTVVMSVDDLQANNAQNLDQMKTATYSPPQCKPTADDALNRAISPQNTSLLVTQGPNQNSITELVTTVIRDIDSDRRTGTGACATVTTSIHAGLMAGATMVTESRELPIDKGAASDAFVARQIVTTTLPNNPTQTATSLVGYAIVGKVTVQLTGHFNSNPMPNEQFVRIFSQAIAAADKSD
ncbi:hypothetical protein [Jongsikchunia kroppenstedtii]|uniref:hypothetical protein n=1 Tax=Jongsikchunia kroppenstedtii TaxID=1121721 RepID=UPI0012DE06BF|nr:hypothetical protein [Jongsikchunia kroppenstedtii]